MREKKPILTKEQKTDHRIIAKELDLYILDEKVGQGLPILLPNYVVIYEQIKVKNEKR